MTNQKPNEISWGDVAEASSTNVSTVESNAEIQGGDIAHHPAFGECNVLTVDSEYINIAPENGRLYKLKRGLIQVKFFRKNKSNNEFQLEMKRQK